MRYKKKRGNLIINSNNKRTLIEQSVEIIRKDRGYLLIGLENLSCLVYIIYNLKLYSRLVSLDYPINKVTIWF